MGKPDGEVFNMGGGQLTAKSTKIGKPVFHFSPAVLGFGVFCHSAVEVLSLGHMRNNIYNRDALLWQRKAARRQHA